MLLELFISYRFLSSQMNAMKTETLTLMPMSLLTGFMVSEHTKPLTYITSGMMAMKF